MGSRRPATVPSTQELQDEASQRASQPFVMEFHLWKSGTGQKGLPFKVHSERAAAVLQEAALFQQIRLPLVLRLILLISLFHCDCVIRKQFYATYLYIVPSINLRYQK